MNNSVNSSSLLAPSQVAELLIQPVIGESVAAQVSRVILSNTNSLRVPIVTDDPSAAWVPEGGEIPISDLEVTELEIPALKLAGLTMISNELIADSGPDVAAEVGRGLARDLARQLDAAYFGTTVTNGPSGLASLSGIQSVVTAGAFENLDPFSEAQALTETVGATVGAFVTSPQVALQLAKLKTGSGSNAPLLGSDPTQPTKRVIAGVPLVVSPKVEANAVWAIPAERAVVTIRQDADIASDGSVGFTSARTAVRAIMRVGIGFPHPAAIVKITQTL
ncbi:MULTISPECIES: phage major capsid protein [Rhodococcus]|uniref:phage major capsid protein n=1 Tax=Rhodococcus TaxID=1827 RepID=UPI0008062832|nr:phage major capsid protein [Rhodococcus sp. 008]ANQ71720.1 capsid protein [Rhodococcus sp. 008]